MQQSLSDSFRGSIQNPHVNEITESMGFTWAILKATLVQETARSTYEEAGNEE